MGYQLLFTSYILLVPEPTSLDVLINSDLDIKTRNNLIYECIPGFFFFFQIKSTQNSKTYHRFCLSSRSQQCLFLVTAFVLNSIQIAPLPRTTQHIFCRYERKKINIQALYYCQNQKCSVILFFSNRYTYIIKKLLITNHSQRYA